MLLLSLCREATTEAGALPLGHTLVLEVHGFESDLPSVARLVLRQSLIACQIGGNGLAQDAHALPTEGGESLTVSLHETVQVFVPSAALVHHLREVVVLLPDDPRHVIAARGLGGGGCPFHLRFAQDLVQVDARYLRLLGRPLGVC